MLVRKNSVTNLQGATALTKNFLAQPDNVGAMGAIGISTIGQSICGLVNPSSPSAIKIADDGTVDYTLLTAFGELLLNADLTTSGNLVVLFQAGAPAVAEYGDVFNGMIAAGPPSEQSYLTMLQDGTPGFQRMGANASHLAASTFTAENGIIIQFT